MAEVPSFQVNIHTLRYKSNIRRGGEGWGVLGYKSNIGRGVVLIYIYKSIKRRGKGVYIGLNIKGDIYLRYKSNIGRGCTDIQVT